MRWRRDAGRGAGGGTRRLVVSADRRQLRFTQKGGHGRVWHEVLPRLAAIADLRLPYTRVTPEGARLTLPPGRCPDVWLIGGGPWPSAQPVVSVIYEVGWHTPYLRSLLTPEFASMADGATRTAVEASDWVIVPAEASRSQVVEAYQVDPDRVRVVPLGVDLDRFRPGLGGGRQLVARARGGLDGPYVLFTGNLGPRKNLVAVRRAMAGIARRGLPHCLVVVAGGAPDRVDPEADRMAGAELEGAPGRVVRIRKPSDNDLAALMAGADAFCMPSLAEGFGLPVLEAMACGTAVVTSNRGSLPEVVGEAGLAVEPTADAIEEALATVLTGDQVRSRLAAAGRARAETMSWEATARGWLEVMSVAAARGR